MEKKGNNSNNMESSIQSLAEGQVRYFNKFMEDSRMNAEMSGKFRKIVGQYTQRLYGHYTEVMQKTFEEMVSFGQNASQARDPASLIALQREAGAHAMKHAIEHIQEAISGAIDVNNAALQLTRARLDEFIASSTEDGDTIPGSGKPSERGK